MRRLHDTRRRLASLASGDHLALPQNVVDYLDRLRDLGVDERYVELERDSWIMIAAQVPHLIKSVIAKKHQDLDDPDMVKLYHLVSKALDWPADEPRVVEIADIVERITIRAAETSEMRTEGLDDPFVHLLDTTIIESSPVAERVVAILQDRGWRGWTQIERAPDNG